MAEPTESRPLKRSIPLDLQTQVEDILTKVPRTTDYLDDSKKRWLIVGICLHTIIAPVLRTYVVPVVTKLCYSLTSRKKIHKQTFPSHLQRYAPTNTQLNYEAINNNKTVYGRNRARYDYCVKNPVDLSRLFLQTYMAHFTDFDDSCDSSALLAIIVNIDRFPPVVQTYARKIRSDIRNTWARCDFTEWTAIKYTDSFQLMGHLIRNLKLSNREENKILGELNRWETNGQLILSGTTPGAGLGEILQQTLFLIKNPDIMLRKSEELISMIRVPQELEEMENGLHKLLDKIRDLKNESQKNEKKAETETISHGNIPESILRMDNESIRIYMEALRSGSEMKHDIRVIVVGKKGAGKTSLVRKLLKEKLDNIESTNGIDIHVKKCKIRTADGKWIYQNGSYDTDHSQRILKSMINHKREQDSSDVMEEKLGLHDCINEEKNRFFKEEGNTTNENKDKLELNNLHAISTVKEMTESVPSKHGKDYQDLTEEHESTNKEESLSATHNLHGRNLQKVIDSAKDMDDKEYATLSLWDFAGDREFYNTHQTFLSEEAVYLVVTKLNEADDETNETLKFWFDSVHFYGGTQIKGPGLKSHTNTNNDSTQIYNRHDLPDRKGKTTCLKHLEPPIIAIGTHKDQCKGNFTELLQDQIRNKLGDSAARKHLRFCHYISNTTDEDDIFEVLRKDIFKVGKKMPDFGKLLPVRFIQLEKSLDGKLQGGTQFLSFGDVKTIAESTGAITDIAELDVFLRYHHDFGNLIYFKDIPEYIILNPQWLVNVFRLLVTADQFRDKLIGHKEWDEYETTGKLTASLLTCIFANQTDDITTCKEHILKIMEKFDIIIRPRMLFDDKEQVDPHFYVPRMIKTIASKQIQEQLKTPQEKSYCLCLEFNFLPPVFINHFIIACIRKFTTSKFRDHNRSPRLALFRRAGLFNINANGCEKLLVASFKNFIQFQIWKFDLGCRTSYKHIGKFILEEVDKIIHKNYQLRCINYEVKMKCESTSYDCFDGIRSPDDYGHDYFCEEHDEMHVYRDDWFSEHKVMQKTAECQTEQDNTIGQKKEGHTICLDFKFPQNMNKGSLSTEEMNMTKLGKVALDILADVLYDLLRLDTHHDPKHQIYPRSHWDISKLYDKHRKLNYHTPSQSNNRRDDWGGNWNAITVSDIGIGDDIERIRLIRNELQHSTSFAVDDSRYNELCTILQDVLHRFDLHNKPSHLYETRFKEILQKTFEKEDVQSIQVEVTSKL